MLEEIAHENLRDLYIRVTKWRRLNGKAYVACGTEGKCVNVQSFGGDLEEKR